MVKLHRNGRFRRWLGARFGGDEAFGDRVWRRLLHVLGASILVYEPLPYYLLGRLSKPALLLTALAVLYAIEALRHAGGVEVPAMRGYEARRPASFVFYGTALVAAVLLLPWPIAAATVLGTAWVDPLIGELRLSRRWSVTYPYLPWAVWVGLGVFGLWLLGGWPLVPSVALALAAGAWAIAAERPVLWWSDDDLAMTFVPAAVLYLIGVLVLGL